MRKDKVLIIAVFFIVIASFPQTRVFAQGGSLYTRYGIGDVFQTYTARKSVIGAGVSVFDKYFLSPVNPASFANLKITRFSVGLNYIGYNLSNSTDNAFYSATDFTGFSLGFPLQRDYGLSFVLGILPYSKVQYAVSEKNIQLNPETKYDINLEGSGSLNKIFLGTSYSTGYGINLGATFEIYTGNIKRTSDIAFNETAKYNSAGYSEEYTYSGLGTTFGLITENLAPILGVSKINDLRIGLSYNFTGELNTDTSLTSATNLGAVTVEKGLTKTKIPSKLLTGLSFVWDENYLVTFDYMYQPWSGYTYNSKPDKHLQDSYAVSAGMEYHRGRETSTRFWELFRIWGGLRFEKTPYLIKGISIEEYSINTGFSIPLGLRSSVDIGFSYGIRGSNELNLINEKIIKTFISINLGEIWFIRQER